jgi:hypothetical protein
MTGFLDTLIDRHTNDAPQIVPRIASIYEPEVSPGGWTNTDLNDAWELEEGFDAEPAVPINETARMHGKARDFQSPAAPDTPAAVEPVQEKVGPGLITPDAKAKARVMAGLQEPESSFSLRAKAPEGGFTTSLADTRITPAMSDASQEEQYKHVFPGHQATQGNQVYVNKTHEGKQWEPGKSRLNAPSPTRQNVNTDFTETASAPFAVKVRQLRQEEPAEHKPGYSEASRDEQSLDRTNPAEREFPLSPPARLNAREVNSASDRRTSTFPEKAQGFLNPSAALISPALPIDSGQERPVARPEPVINVTIGRIEVRATPAPQKPSPKPANRPPMMGLDEYLRRRTGGHDQ